MVSEGETNKTEADYIIIGTLAVGGMGTVYEARQTATNRTVALKHMRKDLPQHDGALAFFLSEAFVTAHLEHPNIVPVHDFGRDTDQRPFYVMKHIRGEEWAKTIEAKSETENLGILLKVCDALAFAHSRGVVHLDLKPENIMIGEFGEVIVMDWGTAAGILPHAPAEPLRRNELIFGTPAYMAPEMAKGDVMDIGLTTDIYLLGGVLHRILTGEPPHSGSTQDEALGEAVRNVLHRKTCTGELMDIALKALSTDPAKRYQNVNELKTALQDYHTHAASLAISRRATEHLAKAAETADYGDYDWAILQFKEALAQWAGNEQARTGWLAARLGYARAAFENSNFDLALTLLDRGEGSHTELLARIDASLANHRRKAKLEKYCTRIIQAEKALDDEPSSHQSILLSLKEHRGWEWGRLMSRCRMALLTLKGHEGAVDALALTHDGRYLLSASADTTARIWDLSLGEEIVAFRGHQAYIRAATCALGRDWAATAGGDTTARIWDIGTGRQLREFRGHSAPVVALAFGPEGRILVTGSADGSTRLWDSDTGKALLTLGKNRAPVLAVALLQDGGHILTVNQDGDLRRWCISSGAARRTIPHLWNDIRALTFSPECRYLGCGGSNGMVRIWDTRIGRESLSVPAHNCAVMAIGFSRDSSSMVTGDEKGGLRCWSVETGSEEMCWQLGKRGIRSAIFSADGRFILTGTDDGLVHVLAREVGPQDVNIVDSTNRVLCAALAPTDPILVTGGNGGCVKTWHSGSGRELRALAGHQAYVSAVAFTPDGRHVVSGSADGTARVWDISTGETTQILGGHAAAVRGVAVSRDGLVATVSDDGISRIWNMETGELRWTVEEPHPRGTCVTFDQEGKCLAVGSASGVTTVWEAREGRLEMILRGHCGPVNSVSFSGDGRRLATAGQDGSTKVWDINTHRETFALSAQHGGFTSVAFSPDGRRLLTGDSEGSGKIWHAEAGAELISIGRHPCAITSVSFSSDGLSIITVCRDGTVRLLPALDWKLSEQEAAEEQVERWRRSLVDKGGYDGGSEAGRD